MSSSCKPCGGTDRRGKAGSKKKGGCPISADGTPKATEPQQADSEKSLYFFMFLQQSL